MNSEENKRFYCSTSEVYLANNIVILFYSRIKKKCHLQDTKVNPTIKTNDYRAVPI